MGLRRERWIIVRPRRSVNGRSRPLKRDVRRQSGDAPCSNSDRPVRTVTSPWHRPLSRRVYVVTSAPSARTVRKGFWRMCALTAVVASRLGQCALPKTGKETVFSAPILPARRLGIVRWISRRTRSSPHTFAQFRRRTDRFGLTSNQRLARPVTHESDAP
jgi:hypothetical protein